MGEVKEIREGVLQHGQEEILAKESAELARKLVENMHALGGEAAMMMMIVMEGKKYLILVEEVQE